MSEDAASLLVFSEIAALVEATTAGSIHVELGRAVELDDQGTHLLRCTLSSRVHVTLDEVDVPDPRKRVFDLVASSVVVNVVSDTSLFRRVENDQVHLTLANTAPCTDRQGAAVEVLND